MTVGKTSAPVETFVIRFTGGDKDKKLVMEWENTSLSVPVTK
jgi:hypothetical protein